MYIIWLRRDGYVGTSQSNSVARFERNWVGINNPNFGLDEVLRTAETWDADLVDFIQGERDRRPHWLHGNAPEPDAG